MSSAEMTQSLRGQSTGVSTRAQYLTFILDDEEYGIDILSVRGIQGWERVTPIPNTPAYMLGVINLRGDVVPIVDLRRRFGLESVPYTPRTVVIVVRVEHKDKNRTIGLVVDAVSEVYNIDTSDLRPSPDLGGAISSDFVRGLAMVEDKMVIVLEIDRLITWGILEQAGAEHAVVEAGQE
jgi:purine-binding chemotaxis protein CheW